ncbi:hypothetical protein COCCADRAFT_24422 [Bipolaris zeicola 26-R-13]|uniref:Uncharacterized protein n=1 Tax=Cochliobolus carbonum (strain 26-R-13) TaxID=930089 RepID=W6YD85_COCC2|nr:uncharacterized protein COCCADRAFT_24422 [Bipolaris zeicola 26-R-13]EUC35608.1 hypothetical protein COCCADRAFT_24422 [Bipolaris zeicola 26-R-13]
MRKGVVGLPCMFPVCVPSFPLRLRGPGRSARGGWGVGLNLSADGSFPMASLSFAVDRLVWDGKGCAIQGMQTTCCGTEGKKEGRWKEKVKKLGAGGKTGRDGSGARLYWKLVYTLFFPSVKA